MDHPRRKYTWTNPLTQQAIIHDRLIVGLSLQETAAKHGVHWVTVSRITGRFKRLAPELDDKSRLQDYKADLRERAIRTILTALTDGTTNTYRRARLALSVMRMIGEFNQDAGQLSGVALTMILGR
jgi:hypothetical protein